MPIFLAAIFFANSAISLILDIEILDFFSLVLSFYFLD